MKKIVIEVKDESGHVEERYNVTFDEHEPSRPWVGGNASGYGDTYRASGLERVMELIAEDITRKCF